MSPPPSADASDALLLRGGRRAWAVVGIAGVLVLVFLLLREVSILVTPLVVAMFPAAVLTPVASWLKRKGVPGAVAALVLLLTLLAVLGLGLWFVVPQFVDQVPELVDSVQEALTDLEAFLADTPVALPFDIGEGGLAGAAQQAFDSFDAGAGDVAGQGLDLVSRVVDLGTALLIFLVALFFYLRDGDRIWAGVTSLLPRTTRRHVRRASGPLWWTLGAYFRAQALVALVDAVAIGIGLLVLGVPLALPLALLVFFGGFFPIVGAFASGIVAVLVALADQGAGTALLVIGLVLLVQQAEGNLLEPLIISPILRLHPFAIILAVSAGAVTYGVLGAFLGVPLAACVGRVVDYVRGRPPAAGPGSDADDRPAWGGSAEETGDSDDAAEADDAPAAGRQAGRWRPHPSDGRVSRSVGRGPAVSITAGPSRAGPRTGRARSCPRARRAGPGRAGPGRARGCRGAAASEHVREACPLTGNGRRPSLPGTPLLPSGRRCHDVGPRAAHRAARTTRAGNAGRGPAPPLEETS